MVTAAFCAIVSVAGCSDEGAIGGAEDQSSMGGSDTMSPTAMGGSAAAGSGSAAVSCTSVRREILQPVDEVSPAGVSVIDTDGSTVTLYIDGAAGGFTQAGANPYVYVNLAESGKEELTDLSADDSTAWDIAVKRQVIRTNSADSGPGNGGAVYLAGTAFEDVTRATAEATELLTDDFINDGDCSAVASGDVGELLTPFSPWFIYEDATMTLTPNDGVFLLRSGDGQRYYKLEILNYYSQPDGSDGPVSARYALRFEEL